MASPVSEYSSLANLPTASSNGPAMTGSAVAKISKTANGSARKFLKTLVSTGRPRQEQREGGGYRRLPWLVLTQKLLRSPDRRTCWSWCCSCLLYTSDA